MTRRLLVVDLPNIAMRCAFGGSKPVAQSTSVAMGMLHRHIRWVQPTHFVCALDGPGPSVRKAKSSAYKRDRTVDTRPFVESVQAQCEARGWVCVSVPGYEADDLLAAFATHAEVDEVFLLTGDSDACTLVRDPGDQGGATVRVVTPANAQHTPTVLDPAAVCAAYGVTHPWQVSHHKALMSEPGDGVDGVPDIGPKRAADLLRAHGTVEGVIAAGVLPGASRWARHVAAHAATARLAYELVELAPDLPLDPAIRQVGESLRLRAEHGGGAAATRPPPPAPAAATLEQLSLL